MSKGNRIRRARQTRSLRIVRNYDPKSLMEKAMNKRRNIGGAQPRMFSRRPRGVKVIADPTPRPASTGPRPFGDDNNTRDRWRRPKRDDGSRIAKRAVRRDVYRFGITPEGRDATVQ